MADFGNPIVENLIKVIGTNLIKEICFEWGYESELEEIKKNIITIKAVLVDAEAKRDLSMVQRLYISELKAAVYDADDLFDELFTLVKLKEIDRNRGGKFSFNKNKYNRAKQMSQRVLIIAQRLHAIAVTYKEFELSIDYTPIVRRREEIRSYVDVKDIIGRDTDKKEILDVLLDPSASNDFCILSIVGVGGWGKTALAQLVYQDNKIQVEFNLSLWVCVSDQDGVNFDVKIILCKILKSLEENVDSSCTMEEVHMQFIKRFTGEKYFLVLDDVWNEDHEKWLELEEYLRMGQRGSKIVVTTRSKKTASIIGSKHVHELQRLTHRDSLRLFEMTAFEERENDPELVQMGKSIVKKCCNSPLAITILGSLLYGEKKSIRKLIEKRVLGESKEGSNYILLTLKLSYYNLTPSLKKCFSYCSIFPNDFEMDKNMLISLWLAQGYIVPLVSGQTIEDAAEESFLILLHKYFFKDVKKDKWGDVMSVKMHDFMHKIAQEMSGEETCVVASGVRNLEKKKPFVMCILKMNMKNP